MKITFFGAAREVTGSCFLVESEQVRFLVDCGLHQGGAWAAERNFQPSVFDPRSIDFVLLTHAHLDHSGLLPKLSLAGYAGPVFTTDATADLLEIMLPDSGHLQEVEAQRALRHPGANDRTPGAGTPLYTAADAVASLAQVHRVKYDRPIDPHPQVRCTFRDAGHILGSAIIEVWLREGGESRKLVFSGDLGQPGRQLLHDPTLIPEADVLLVESTYGNRAHRSLAATLDEFVYAVNHTLHEKGGNVIVPAFAVGRTQEILHYFNLLTRQGRFHDLLIYVDSPMATAATQITMRHLEILDAQTQRLATSRDAHFAEAKIRFVETVQESMALNNVHSGAIIVSASGMCDGGRVKHHLRHNIGSAQNTILITGFQAQGTLGRRLVDGAKSVHLFGEEVTVRAEIFTLGGFSAHADQPALLRWLRSFKRSPGQTFIVHGEQDIALAFAEEVKTQLGWNVSVPNFGDSVQF